LTGRAQTCGLQHFVDVVPGTAGQRRLARRTAACGTGSVIIQHRTVVAHFHVRHRTRWLSTIAMEYKKEIR
jgi:hypothetical protein